VKATRPSGGFDATPIALDDISAALVRRGAPEIDLVRIPRAFRREPGAGASLLDPRGKPMGAGIADPERGVLRIWSRDPVDRFDAGFFVAKLAAAIERRRELSGGGPTDAFRLLHGDGDGLSGLAIDCWGRYLTLQAFGTGPWRWVEPITEALKRLLTPRGIVAKLIPVDETRSSAGRGKVTEEVVIGDAPPEVLTVHEDGIPFAVRLRGSRHAGLFTDMRDERRRVAAIASGRRVLNLFAYTGAFSVVAARAGAAEVITVDVVAKVLDWAKENFRLSGLDPAAHRFARMDAIEYLALARKKNWRFGAVILDPPTFAAAGRTRWSLRRDYPRLLRAALEVLAPGGYLWVCANTSALGEEELDEWIAATRQASKRRLHGIARAGQPVDYPAPEGFPRYRYLKIRVLRG